MNLDNYQKAWQSHTAESQFTVDEEMLLNILKLDQQRFRFFTDWNQLGNTVIWILTLPIWFYMGATASSPWTWYLAVPVMVWNIVFVLLYRMRRRQKSGIPNEPLRQCVEESLTQVEDQIWLQRSSVWRELLPISAAILISGVHTAWLNSDSWPDAQSAGVVVVFLSFVAAYFGIRRGISKLETRRQEVSNLLASLSDETGSEKSHNSVKASVSRFAKNGLMNYCGYPREAIVIGVFALVVAAQVFACAVIFFGGN